MKATWAVAVVYEDDDSRNLAVKMCDQMVARFWETCSFDIHWTSFADLQSEVAARMSQERVVASDFIVLAAKPAGEFPLDFVLWLHESLEARQEKEGALVAVFGPGDSSIRDVHCRNMAHSHGLDYWTEIPHQLWQPQPDSPEWCTRRADQVTSVLDDILNRPTVPTRDWI